MKSRPSSNKGRQTKATLLLTTYLLLSTTTTRTKGNLSIIVTATPFHHIRPLPQQHRHLRLPACFAAKGGGGGGGFGTNKKTSTSPSNKKRPSNSNTHTHKNTKKSKSKTGSLFFDEILSSSQPSPSSTDTTTQTLDRFGLPPPTIDDVFPPLSMDVSRVPVHSKRHPDDFDKDEVAEAMKNHLGVDLDIFDDRGYSIHVECDDDDEIQKWKLNLLHKDPPVFTIENFFTPRECEMYKSLVLEEEDRFAFGDDNAKTRDSAVKVTSPTFAASSISKRTSTTWFCRYETVPTLLAKVQRLLGDGGGNNGGVGLERMEEPQIVRYRTGEEFSWHYDEIPSSQLSNGGQRQATLLVYLNDLDEDQGGGTVFRDLTPPIPYDRDDADDNETRPSNKKRSKSKRNTNDTRTNQLQNQPPQLTVRPKTGMALLFFPSYRDGTPDIRTLHKGEVALSQKMIAQVWVHEREYRAGVPEGNRQEDAVEGVERERERLGFC